MRKIPELWNPVFVRQAAELFRSTKAIARNLHCDPTTVKAAFTRYGIAPPRNRYCSKLTVGQKQKLRTMVSEGCPHRSIARVFGIDSRVVTRLYANKEGLPKVTALRRYYNHSSTPHGRWRQRMIYQAAKLRQRGLSRGRIAAQLRLGEGTVQKMMESPYFRALFHAWGERLLPRKEVNSLRCEMREAGFDEALIEKTLPRIEGISVVLRSGVQ